MGNNTFGGTFAGQTPGAFGTYFGGILVQPYLDYLIAATGGRITIVTQVPEPGSLVLLLVGLGAIAARRRKAA